MDAQTHRFLFDTYIKLTRILFWTCPKCIERVQRYLMNGTPVDRCGICGTKNPEMPLDEDRVVVKYDEETGEPYHGGRGLNRGEG